MDKSALKIIWDSNQWFRDLPSEVIDELIDISCVRSLADGQILYVKNDPADGFYGVLEGAIRIGASSAEGKHTVYTIMKSGSWIGEVSMFDGQPRVSEAVASGPTKVLFVSRDKFRQLLDCRPELYKHFILLVCYHYRRAVSLVEDRKLRGLHERLAGQLVFLAEQHGVSAEEGVEIDLRLSQEELASLVGATRQRINKVLKDWEREQLIMIKYSRITIKDSAALASLVNPI